MRSLITLLFLVTISFYSCGDSNKNANQENKTSSDPSENSNNSQGQTQTNTNTQKTESNTPSTHNKVTQPGEIRVEFPKGSTQVTLNHDIKGLSDKVTYVFEVSKGQKLNASVNPSKGTGNIRFNQLFSPSGNIEGPFGNTLQYDLNESGDWKLVVGESNMEGTPYEGEFLLTLSIK